ncbi:MAG: hypothetical protein OEZ48_14110, partial [Candidatus Bathyarchaeota archaeon]|nr:hypothetical protein [Candidatus Bathyarchaeota archaeon]
IKQYITGNGYHKVIIMSDPNSWEDEVAKKLNQIGREEGFTLETIRSESDLRNKDLIQRIVKTS